MRNKGTGKAGARDPRKSVHFIYPLLIIPPSPWKGDRMFQEEFIELLKHMASTTVKDIFGCEFRPPCQGGKTTGKGPMGPWVAGSDETGALDPACGTTTFRRSAAGPFSIAKSTHCLENTNVQGKIELQLRNSG
jgi:hypothetical protein